jgi:hypothetical protein
MVLNLVASRLMSPLILINLCMSRGDLFWSPWISLDERSRLSFALAIFYVQVRNYFLLPVMSTRVVSGKSKPTRVGLRTGIPRLRMPMNGIPF